MSPVICFGQQPSGFFPKRFLAAKIFTARRLQSEIGGEIVFFFHDSDHDPRETRTLLRHRATDEPAQLNFSFANRTPAQVLTALPETHPCRLAQKTAAQLPNYVGHRCIDLFNQAAGDKVASFCLGMYRLMGLLKGIRVVSSSDPAVRRAACDVPEFFIDVPYEGEIVRARSYDGALKLHEGGDSFVTLPPTTFTKEQVSPTRDTRLRWMQSVIHCTHYVAGAGENAYLRREDTPEITFITRDPIDRSDEAYTEIEP